MLQSSRRNTRRAGSLVATIGMLFAMFLVASPAQAAVAVDLSASSTTITLGQQVTLSWSASQDATELTASGAWSGSKGLPNGAESITPGATGDFTYTLLATDENGRESSDSVTVTVLPGPITPNAVTFPDPCTVVIPTTANVTYFVDFGDNDVEELEAGTYDGTEFSLGDQVTFFAEANDGFTLADGAVAEWDYTAPESCLDVDEGPDFVETAVECGSVTFTNLTDGPIEIMYGSFDEDDSDGELTLAAGESDAVDTDRADFGFIASPDLDDEQAEIQIREIEVPQDCDGGSGESGSGSGHPTTAPAAGMTR